MFFQKLKSHLYITVLILALIAFVLMIGYFTREYVSTINFSDDVFFNHEGSTTIVEVDGRTLEISGEGANSPNRVPDLFHRTQPVLPWQYQDIRRL